MKLLGLRCFIRLFLTEQNSWLSTVRGHNGTPLLRLELERRRGNTIDRIQCPNLLFASRRRRSDSFVVICQMRSKKSGSFPLPSSLPLFSCASLMMFARVFTIAVQTRHSPHSLLGILGTAQESKVEGRSCT